MSLHQHHPYMQYAPQVMQHYAPPQSPAHPPAPQQQQQQQPQQTPTPTPATIAPNDTYTQHTTSASPNPNQMQTQGQQQSAPLVAQGDWTKNLVHLAKTAELKKHALTLQLHTAHILSANSQLDVKSKALQDVKEEKNRLESERTRLLSCLRQVNEDRDKADLAESSINKEISELHAKIKAITDGDYAIAKREVDALRAELGQPPTPGLQQLLEEKSSAYLNERRLNGASVIAESASPVSAGAKRAAAEPAAADTPVKRPRGRPKGSKNKKNLTAAGNSSAGTGGGDAAGE